MKSLLALTLVVALSSAAGAALTWNVDRINLGVGAEYTVTISSSTNLSYDIWVGSRDSHAAEVLSITPLPAAGDNAVAAKSTQWR